MSVAMLYHTDSELQAKLPEAHLRLGCMNNSSMSASR